MPEQTEKKPMLQRTELLPCPFCGSMPYFELGKRGSCQLHGEPMQSVIIRCKKPECPVNPMVAAGDIFCGGEDQARRRAAELWNARPIAQAVAAERKRSRGLVDAHKEIVRIRDEESDGMDNCRVANISRAALAAYQEEKPHDAA